jgi:outer membrane autotransporter protein
MGAAIERACPTISANSPGSALAVACSGMIGSAYAREGGSPPAGTSDIGLTIPQLQAALQEVNGGAETLVPTNQVSQLRTSQVQVLGARLTVLRTHMLGSADDGSNGGVRLAANDTGSVRDAPGLLRVAQASPTEVSIWSGKLGLFGNILGQFGSRDPTATQNGFSFNTEGVLMGGDYRFTPNLAFGAAFGYNYTNSDFDSNATSPSGQYLNSNLYQFNFYGTYAATDALYFDGLVSFGVGDNETRRRIIVPTVVDTTADGKFDTQTIGVSVGGGYNFPFGSLTLTPTARFEYHYVRSDRFTESGGAGLNLAYGPAIQTAVLTFIGGQATYAISTDFGVLSPSVRANWAHQYNDGRSSMSITFVNDPSLTSAFVMPGDASDRNYFQVGAGLALQLAGNKSAFINYDAIVGLTKTSYNAFTAGMRFDF